MFRKIVPSSGGGQNIRHAKKCIRLARYGCTNRPFYHIVVLMKGRSQHEQPIEQLGTYDPMPNERNEKLVSLNLERIQYWLGQGSDVSTPVSQLFGLAGFFPVHPNSYKTAWRNRHKLLMDSEKAKEKDESVEMNEA